MNLTRRLTGLGACSEAISWAVSYGSEAEAWDACPNPSWLFWAISRSGVSDDDPRYAVLAQRICRETPLGDGRTLWHIMPEDSRQALDLLRDGKRKEAQKLLRKTRANTKVVRWP